MNLFVTDVKRDVSFNEITMSIAEFCFIGNHPYIATAGFDNLIIDLDDRIPPGFLKAVVGKFNIIPKITGDITTDTVRLLGEIYREKDLELKKSWFKGKDAVKQLVKELEEQYKWCSYY